MVLGLEYEHLSAWVVFVVSLGEEVRAGGGTYGSFVGFVSRCAAGDSFVKRGMAEGVAVFQPRPLKDPVRSVDHFVWSRGHDRPVIVNYAEQ